MSVPFVGEIRMFAFGRVPNGWFACDGSLKSIAENEVLFTLLGTTYGGDGVNQFGVPDLRGRLPVSQGQGPALTMRSLGEVAGTETVTLSQAQMPAHTHQLVATSAAATLESPRATALPAAVSGQVFYVTDVAGATSVAMEPSAVTTAGGSQPHQNCMPSMTVQYCIAAYGVFPAQS